MKKILILQDSKASIDKQYAMKHKMNSRKMEKLRNIKKSMSGSIQIQDRYISEKMQ